MRSRSGRRQDAGHVEHVAVTAFFGYVGRAWMPWRGLLSLELLWLQPELAPEPRAASTAAWSIRVFPRIFIGLRTSCLGGACQATLRARVTL